MSATFNSCVFGEERKELADFLTSYLSEEEGVVLNLNGEWGVGKTFFVESWIDSIKDRHPAIYIDAWRTDFSEDPMIVVVDTILDFFKNSSTATDPDLEKKIIMSAGKLLASTAQVGAGVATYLSGLGAGAGDKAVSSVTNLIGEYLNVMPEAQFENYRQRKDAVDDFKKLIQEWLECHMGQADHERQLPVFVFVDELDRCRPTYAIEMLEVIKHFFNLNNFVFVVSTDTGQLSESIKAVYGSGFDSKNYLSRFFNRTCSLSIPNYRQFCKGGELLTSLSKNKVKLILASNNLQNLFSDICQYYMLNLREVEQVSRKLTSIFRYLNEKNKVVSVNFIYLISTLIEEQYKPKCKEIRINYIEIRKSSIDTATQDKYLKDLKINFDQSANSDFKDGERIVSVSGLVGESYKVQSKFDEETYEIDISKPLHKLSLVDRILYQSQDLHYNDSILKTPEILSIVNLSKSLSE